MNSSKRQPRRCRQCGTAMKRNPLNKSLYCPICLYNRAGSAGKEDR